jgi:uncharacterized membrane protein
MAKFLRFIGIVFISLTAFITLMGGIGTTCVALAAEKYGSMAAIAPYKWLYVIFVLVTTAIGVMGVRAVVLLIKRKANAYNYALLTLVLGVVVGVIHMLVSRSLRGSSMPVDAVVYTTVLTLIIFLIFRIPPIWAKVDFANASKSESNTSGGTAAIVSGVMALTIQYTMAPTHTISGVNYADAFHTAMTLSGLGLILLGIGLLILNFVSLPSQQEARLAER